MPTESLRKLGMDYLDFMFHDADAVKQFMN